MFIFVGCAGGGTSSLFCQQMVKEITNQDKNLTAVFAHYQQVMDKQRAYGNTYDLVFAYGGIDGIAGYNAFEFGKLFDVVLVAPQVRYRTKDKQELLANYPTIVRDIPSKLFGQMNGEKAYNELLADLIELDDQRAYFSSIFDPTRAADKNMEILILAGEGNNNFIIRLLSYWRNLGLRIITDSYRLETLYDFAPQADYDLRILFASSAVLNTKELPKVARRIDGIIVAPIGKGQIKKWQQVLTSYQLPVYQLEDDQYYDLRGKAELACLDDFLLDLGTRTEYTQEIMKTDLEKEKLKPRKKILFGLISWE